MHQSAQRIAGRVGTVPAACGSVRVVCVDGPAGSGKTTLADRLAGALGPAPVPVVHMDDLYEGWEQNLAELGSRVRAWLLDAWAAGLPGRHLRYDWAAGRYSGWVSVPADPVIILEGCASASARIRERASLVVWVEAPLAVRTERGLARDGEAMAPDWRRWQRREAAHFAADATRAAADVVIDGRTGRIEAD